jgi:hypothetical protein
MDALSRPRWAPMTAALAVAAVLVAAACSDDVVGLDDTRTPLATLEVRVDGDFSALANPRVTLIWADQAIVETFCWLAPLHPDAEVRAVAAAGCRDPLGFYPGAVGISAPVDADGLAVLEIYDLPLASQMVGEVTGRVAYASVVLYDDVDGDGSLELRWPRWNGGSDLEFDDEAGPRGGRGGGKERGAGDSGRGGGGAGDASSGDASGGTDTGSGSDAGGNARPGGDAPELDLSPQQRVYAASFITMAKPNVRVAFREGTFDAASAFYPRVGCPPPAKGYSVLGNDGFSALDALTALPNFPPTTGCTASSLDDAEIVLALDATETADQVGCTLGRAASTSGTARYRQPPQQADWLANATWVCSDVTNGGLGGLFGAGGDGGGGGAGGGGGDKADAPVQQELIIAYPETSCRALRHYVLRGCRYNAACKSPDWDISAHPPAWWPCAGGATGK